MCRRPILSIRLNRLFEAFLPFQESAGYSAKIMHPILKSSISPPPYHDEQTYRSVPLKREGKNGDSFINDNFGRPAEGTTPAAVVAAEITLASLLNPHRTKEKNYVTSRMAKVK